MNRRTGRAMKHGQTSLVATLPKPWVDGEEIEHGDLLEVFFDGLLIIAKPEDAKRAREILRRIEAGA